MAGSTTTTKKLSTVSTSKQSTVVSFRLSTSLSTTQLSTSTDVATTTSFKSNIPGQTTSNGKSTSMSNSTRITVLSNSTNSSSLPYPILVTSTVLGGIDPNLGAATNPESAMFIFYIVLAVILVLLAGCFVENIYSRSENRKRNNRNQKNQITMHRSASDEQDDIERASRSTSKAPTQARNQDTQAYGTKTSRKGNESGTFKK